MSDLDDFDLDDFEFDDSDLGFPDLDDPDRIPTKREAIVNSAAAAAEGLKTKFNFYSFCRRHDFTLIARWLFSSTWR